jgi:hypothetical protein
MKPNTQVYKNYTFAGATGEAGKEKIAVTRIHTG